MTQATLKLQHLCAKAKPAPFRTEYNPRFYKFKVAVVTENSSISFGQQTSQTSESK